MKEKIIYINILPIERVLLNNIRVFDNCIVLLYSGLLNTDIYEVEKLIKIFDKTSLELRRIYSFDILLGFDYRDYDNVIYVALSINGYKENLRDVYNMLQDFSYFINTSLPYDLKMRKTNSDEFEYNESELAYNSEGVNGGILNILDTQKITKIVSLRYSCDSMYLTFSLLFNILYGKKSNDFLLIDTCATNYKDVLFFSPLPLLWELIGPAYLERIDQLYQIALSCFNYQIKNKYTSNLVGYTNQINKKIYLDLNDLYMDYCEVTKDSLVLSFNGNFNSVCNNGADISNMYKDSLEKFREKVKVSDIFGGLFVERETSVNFMISVKDHKITFDLLLQVLNFLYNVVGLEFDSEFITSEYINGTFKDFNIAWLRGVYVKIGETHNFVMLVEFADSREQCVLRISDYNTKKFSIVNNKYSLLYKFFFDFIINIYYYMSTGSIIWLFEDIFPCKFIVAEELTEEFRNKIWYAWKCRLLKAARCCAYYENGLQNAKIIEKYLSRLAEIRYDLKK